MFSPIAVRSDILTSHSRDLVAGTLRFISLSFIPLSARLPCRKLPFMRPSDGRSRSPSRLRGPVRALTSVFVRGIVLFGSRLNGSASRRFTQAVWAAFQRNAGHDATSFGHVSVPPSSPPPRCFSAHCMWGATGILTRWPGRSPCSSRCSMPSLDEFGPRWRSSGIRVRRPLGGYTHSSGCARSDRDPASALSSDTLGSTLTLVL